MSPADPCCTKRTTDRKACFPPPHHETETRCGPPPLEAAARVGPTQGKLLEYECGLECAWFPLLVSHLRRKTSRNSETDRLLVTFFSPVGRKKCGSLQHMCGKPPTLCRTYHIAWGGWFAVNPDAISAHPTGRLSGLKIEQVRDGKDIGPGFCCPTAFVSGFGVYVRDGPEC